MMHFKKKKKVKKCRTVDREMKQREIKYTWMKHLQTHLCQCCVRVFLGSLHCELWGRCLQLRAALAVSSNRLFEHIALFSPMKPVSVSALCQGLPPTLFICSLLTCAALWPGRMYTCDSLYLQLPWGELRKALLPLYNVQNLRSFVFLKGAIILCSLFLTWC